MVASCLDDAIPDEAAHHAAYVDGGHSDGVADMLLGQRKLHRAVGADAENVSCAPFHAEQEVGDSF